MGLAQASNTNKKKILKILEELENNKEKNNKTINDLNRLIEKTLENSNIPGCAIAIVRNGKIIYFKGRGYGNIEKKTEITTDSIFRLASISKLFTTIAILKLKEQIGFSLDDPVESYLKKGKFKIKKGWKKITFRHLLTHTSGIGELPKKSFLFKQGFGLNVKWPKEIPPLEKIHEIKVKPETPAGEKYSYCNFGFSLLGYIIERITNMPFEEYMKKEIFKPLQMYNSDFIRSKEIMKKEVIGYIKKRKGYKIATYWQGIIKPAGMLYSNIKDMANFASFLDNFSTKTQFSISLNNSREKEDNDDKYRDKEKREKGYKNQEKIKNKILKTETMLEAWEPQYYSHHKMKKFQAIGLGFHIFFRNGMKILEHNGATSGFTSCFTYIPTYNLAILVFSNLDEIFHSDKTLRLKNEIINFLFPIHNNHYMKIKKEGKIIEKQNYINYFLKKQKKISGIYRPIGGFLTNTGIYQNFGEFYLKILKTNKENELYQIKIKSLYGTWKKWKCLEPTKDHYVFKYNLLPGTSLLDKGIIIIENDNNPIIALGFYKLFKIKFLGSLKNKLIILILGLSLLTYYFLTHFLLS